MSFLRSSPLYQDVRETLGTETPRDRTSRTGARPWSGDLAWEYGVGVDDDAILALVTRLARPHASGGQVIERAAILAEGADFPEVMEWITAHAGQPEAAPDPRSTRGLHGPRLDGEARPRLPVRFVLPAGALD
jgi:hypothetical protein